MRGLPPLLLVACAACGPSRLFPEGEALFRELMARVDDDRDGTVSQAEYERYSAGREDFEDQDLDGDGRLGWEEVARAVLGTDPGYLNADVAIRDPDTPAPPPRGPVPTGKRPPNVILVGFDTLRADHLSCYGYARPTSPSVDRFAARSTLYERAFSQANETLFSFASTFTSRMPSELAPLTYMDFNLPATTPVLAEVLRAYGYDTAAFVAGGNLHHAFGFDRGFDVYQDTWSWGSFFHTVPAALHWLDARDPTRPFFLFVHGYDAHSPYNHPLFFENLFGPGYNGLADQFKAHPTRIELFWKDRFHLSLEPLVQFAQTPQRVPYMTAEVYELLRRTPPEQGIPVTPEDAAHLVAHYDGSVVYADLLFGLLLAGLEDRRLLDDALVVVMGDHGEDLLEHGSLNHRIALQDADVHVPLLVRRPGGPEAGVRHVHLVALLDVLPTILSTVGATPPAGTLGQPLGSEPVRDRVWSQGVLDMTAARELDRRLVVTGHRVGSPAFQAWLPDLQVDDPAVTWFQQAPEAPIDLTTASPEELARAAAALEATRALYAGLRIGDTTGRTVLDPRLQELLRQRGYW